MLDPTSLVIRVDASANIGAGHVMRCLALAQEWQGTVIFGMAERMQLAEKRITAEGFQIQRMASKSGSPEDATETSRILHESKAAYLVMDGYSFGPDFQKAFEDSGVTTLVIDDFAHNAPYHCDILLNQNLHAKSEHYLGSNVKKLLLGNEYLLLRREFLKWKSWSRAIPEVARNILITLGASVRSETMIKVLRALDSRAFTGARAVIVLPKALERSDVLAEELANIAIPAEVAIAPSDMSKLYVGADIAITAGGSTCWEMAYLGLPSVSFVLAENQRPVVDSLNSLGVSVKLGNIEDIESADIANATIALCRNSVQRSRMSLAGRRMFDGLGPARVVAELRAR